MLKVMVSEVRERMEDTQKPVSSLQRCKFDFGGYFLDSRQNPLQIDLGSSSLPLSPAGTETPPLSPGMSVFLSFFPFFLKDRF